MGKLHFVSDDEHRHTLLRQLTNDAEHLANHRRVKSRRGFVKEDNLGVHG